jgi:hypothetical protein
MQHEQAADLRRAWGNKPCDHPTIDRLFLRGMHTDYVCTQCGREFESPEEARQARNSRPKG